MEVSVVYNFLGDISELCKCSQLLGPLFLLQPYLTLVVSATTLSPEQKWARAGCKGFVSSLYP